jgi:hypothetical protein
MADFESTNTNPDPMVITFDDATLSQDARVSLSPLEPEEALRALLATPPLIDQA